MTVDGVMRIWVEVTVSPPPSIVPNTGSQKEAPERAQQIPKADEQVLSFLIHVTCHMLSAREVSLGCHLVEDALI